MTTSTDSGAPAGVGVELALRQLSQARATRVACAPVRGLLPAGDLDAAYAVQRAWLEQRTARGARVLGRKIGLTNPAVQRQLGVDQPDFGVLLDDMDCTDRPSVPTDLLLQPKIEAEVGFVLARDLDGESISTSDVAAATQHVVAALEIVDSRIANWDIGIVDTVADNASSGLYVLGRHSRHLGDLELASATMSMWQGERLVSAGTGTDCLGDPLAAVAWLANTARHYGQPLRAGEVILSGALGPMVPVAPWDEFRAVISGLGEVATRFDRAVPA